MRFTGITFCLFSLISCTHQLPDYTSRLSSRMPTEGRAEAIGEYALGCLQGAETFNGDEKGLHLSQLKRGRYWGHPDMIKLLTKAGEDFYKQNKALIIGDLSQSRGGPTLTGHNSHQNGLDVDIWFKMPELKETVSFKKLETEEMKPVKDLDEDQIKLVKYFSQNSSVERVFINAAFKKTLCASGKLTPDEHHKLRAWWGHDDHIHVRLKCPEGSSQCVSQKPIAPGDGCGEELNWWFSDDAKVSGADATWEDLKATYLEKVKKLPEACSFYFDTF